MSDTELEQLFQQGVSAIRAGDKAKARELLTKVVEANQLHEQAWLWLSAAVTDKEEQILCLENVLTINPRNEVAQRGLRKLGKDIPEPAPEPVETPPPEPEPAKPKPQDSWRDKLSDPHYVSEATIVKPMHEKPNLGLADLANAWMWAGLFQTPGFQDEVDYGPVGHIFVSTALAVFLQLLGVGFYLVVSLTNPQVMAALRRSLSSNLPRNAGASVDRLLPTTATLASLIPLLIGLFVVLVIVTLIGLAFQAIVTNRVAGMMGGQGDTIPLTQALTIALVPSQLIMLPLMIVSALGPLRGIGTVLWGAGYLYQFLQTSNAVNASHRLGIFASMGAVIISAFAMGLIGCCLLFGAQFLLGAGAR